MLVDHLSLQDMVERRITCDDDDPRQHVKGEPASTTLKRLRQHAKGQGGGNMLLNVIALISLI